MIHKYLTTFRVKNMSKARKIQLLDFLASKIKIEKRILFNTGESCKMLTGALSKIRKMDNVYLLDTVEPIVYILGQVAWDALEKNKKEAFYITHVKNYEVFGVAGKLLDKFKS